MATLGLMVSRLKVWAFPTSVSETWPAIFIAIIGVVALPILLIIGDGNIFIISIFLFAITFTFFTFYRLYTGFLIIVGMVLISDSFDIPGFRPFTHTVYYLHSFNLAVKSITGSSPGFGVLSPHEICVLLLLFTWIVVGAIRRNFKIESIPNRLIAALFFLTLLGSFLYGISHGGDPIMGQWEIRALPELILMLFIVPQLIKTKEQVHSLVWLFIFTLSFKSLQAIERFIRLGFQFQGHRTLSNHEDAVFFVLLFLLLASFLIFKIKTDQRRWLSWLSFLLLFGFYLANRRAAYASFVISAVAFYILLDSQQRRWVKIRAGIFAVFFVVYLISFWNNPGRLGLIAQSVKSTVLSRDQERINYQDYLSGLARDQENYNLAVTFRKSPLIGVGFGIEYEWAIRSPGGYALQGYTAHNEILWLLTKLGMVGYYIFLLFLNLAVLYGANTFMNLKDPYLKAVCAVCVVAVLNQIVASHVDMQLTFIRNMFFLGVLTGLVPAMASIDRGLLTTAQKTENDFK